MTARATPRGESGFVLVGVIVFVLALTILGLSLFSLSSYEAQFLGRSLDETQAFLDAQAGIERAKFAMLSTGTLASVKTDMSQNVLYSKARYPVSDDSSGGIAWDDPTPIEVTVIAQVGQERKLLKADFVPTSGPDYYKRLFTSSGTITVLPKSTTAPAGNRNQNTWLIGAAWQNDPDTSWSLPMKPGEEGSWGVKRLLPRGGVDAPMVDQFIAEQWSSATEVVEPGSSNHYRLDGGQSLFKTEYLGNPVSTNPIDDYSLFEDGSSGPGGGGSEPKITVRGPVVWMVKHGIRFDTHVTVAGSGGIDDCLIIVAKPSPGRSQSVPEDKGTGIWFFGGIESAVPIFLVSDGRVVIEHSASPDKPSSVLPLSVYASRIMVKGPATALLTLSHPLSLAPPVIVPLVDKLYALGLLPGSEAGAGHRLALVPGSWSQDP